MSLSVAIEGVEVSWDRRRELFSLDRAVAQLNHGSFGAVPIPVQRAQQRLRDEMEANPMAFFTRGLTDRIAHTRRHLAGFIGADPEHTALVTNATAACQLVLGSLTFGPGDEILLTNHGYGAVRMAVERLCARTGAVLRVVAVPLQADNDEVVDVLVRAVNTGRTALAIIDHITSSTAKLLPVAALVAAMRAHGVPVLVDAAHAPGMLQVDVAALGADFWLGNLHKWAFAPRPTALLAVSAAYRSTIEPLVLSWQQPAGYPTAVEFGGTLDYTPWLAAPAGVHLLRTLGRDRVRQHNADLAAYGQRAVATALGLDPADLPPPPGDQVSMRIVPLPDGVAHDSASAVELRLRLAGQYGCEVALDAWNGRGYVRISGQLYNQPDEYDRLAAALPRAIAEQTSSHSTA